MHIFSIIVIRWCAIAKLRAFFLNISFRIYYNIHTATSQHYLHQFANTTTRADYDCIICILYPLIHSHEHTHTQALAYTVYTHTHMRAHTHMHTKQARV